MDTPTKIQDQSLLVVERQLEAYNNRNIEVFAQCWTEDCENFEFPNRLLARGIDAVMERYVERFKDEALHGKLISRISAANLVIDQELVTRTFPDGIGDVEVVAIYRVAEDKIAQAWFSFGNIRIHK